jgi:4-hydroxy-3-methylbut-2-enyl diphosphate reductase
VVKRLVLASPRGYCAGVERAVETVEQALEQHGAPIYVRKQIVHNAHVVRDLEERGAVFVESEADVPPGAFVVFSAHGVSPAVRERAAARRLRAIDATCPLVSKVHAEARHYARRGYTIFLIGHAGHEEVEGTTGEAPEAVILVQSAAEAESIPAPTGERLVYLTQTTLSVDDTSQIVSVLKRRFPHLEAPPKEDICYATTNRQQAWLAGVESVGLTSGASAPESLVRRVVAWFRERGVSQIEALDSAVEDVFFRLPLEVRSSGVTKS